MVGQPHLPQSLSRWSKGGLTLPIELIPVGIEASMEGEEGIEAVRNEFLSNLMYAVFDEVHLSVVWQWPRK